MTNEQVNSDNSKFASVNKEKREAATINVRRTTQRHRKLKPSKDVIVKID